LDACVRCLAALACLLVAAGSAGAETVFRDPEGVYALTVPEGFEPLPKEQIPASMVCMYRLQDAPGNQDAILLAVQDLNGTLGRESPTKEDMAQARSMSPPQVSEVAMAKAPWQGFEVDVVVTKAQTKLGRAVAYCAQVPTRPHAIQLTVAGPEAREQEVKAHLTAALAGLRGQTNWTRGGGVRMVARTPPSKALLLGIWGAIVLCGGIGLWLLSRVTPAWVPLVVAVGIWMVGNSLPDMGEPVRELYLVSGALKMLGVIGVILGVVDLVRRSRKGHAEKQPPAPPPPPPAS